VRPTPPDLRHLVADLVHAVGQLADEVAFLDQADALGGIEHIRAEVRRLCALIEAASSESPSESRVPS
jgi:hypothetical protein